MNPSCSRYYSLNQYLKETFGCKVYKLALDGGMTCPSRDGTLGWRGCIFCSGDGSGTFAQKRNDGSHLLTIHQQIEQAKERVKKKMSQGKYIAYFQSYTNTYAPVEYLESLFLQAMEHPEVVALSVATRPDCLPPEVLELLGRLNRQKPVWVELGLQTIHPRTAEYIRRGYDLECYSHGVKELKTAGIRQIITHIMLGLPGETPADMVETVKFAAAAGTDGVKLQLLHVLEGTDLAEDYRRGVVPVMSQEEYCNVLYQCIQALPPHVVIHRLTGDGPKRLLIAPGWSGDKKLVLNMILRGMEERDIRQGDVL